MSVPSRFEQDLKLLTRKQLTEKYGEWDWDLYIWNVKNGTPLNPPGPISTVNFTDDPERGTDVPEPEAPAPPYRGRAFGRFVMIRRLEQEHSGRLVMPSRLAGTSDLGWVESAGEECKHIRAGQIVIFDQYAGVGREVRLIGADGLPGSFLLVEEPDVLAVLEKVAQ